MFWKKKCSEYPITTPHCDALATCNSHVEHSHEDPQQINILIPAEPPCTLDMQHKESPSRYNVKQNISTMDLSDICQFRIWGKRGTDYEETKCSYFYVPMSHFSVQDMNIFPFGLTTGFIGFEYDSCLHLTNHLKHTDRCSLSRFLQRRTSLCTDPLHWSSGLSLSLNFNCNSLNSRLSISVEPSLARAQGLLQTHSQSLNCRLRLTDSTAAGSELYSLGRDP
jgi:hypothetical protein